MNLLLDNGYKEESNKVNELIFAIRFDSGEKAYEEEDDYKEYLEQLEDDKVDVKSIEESLMPTWRRILREI